MNFKDIISRRVCDYYAVHEPSASQIAHTMAVSALTRQIALMQQRTERDTDLLEAAAWLHDIGCPDAVSKYGNSLPVHQMAEGERITEEWMRQTEGCEGWQEAVDQLSNEEKHWLARVVGTHHQRGEALNLHFEPLFEADLIINLREGYFGTSQAAHLFDTMTISEEGREMFRRLIG